MPAAVGVPAKVAVPSPLSVKVKPAGNAPVSMMVLTVGEPEVVTVKLPAVPAAKVAAEALVIVGGPPTVTVSVCTALGLTPFAAVR